MSVFDDIKKQIASYRAANAANIVNDLANEGARLCKAAADSKETRNRSGNQADAFGYAVYLNGKIQKKGYAYPSMSRKIHKGWEKHGIPADTGRGYLDDFFANYRPSKMGYTLIVVNAVYYSQILEDGKQSAGAAKYRIISQIGTEMYGLAQKYKGSIDIISPVGKFG